VPIGQVENAPSSLSAVIIVEAKRTSGPRITNITLAYDVANDGVYSHHSWL
jgi:hypothetical protein